MRGDYEVAEILEVVSEIRLVCNGPSLNYNLLRRKRVGLIVIWY